MGAEADASDPQLPEPTRAMQALLPYLRDLVGDSAAVVTEDHRGRGPDDTADRGRPPSILLVHVRPRNASALGFSVICEQWIIVEIGRIGGRWEIDYGDDGIAHARRLLEAAVAGRVVETTALGRSEVVVTFADGSTDRETGYQGCLTALVVLPGWKRWGRRTRYEPYRPVTTD